MALKTHIVDSTGTNCAAAVTSLGQLVVAPVSYDDTQYMELAEDDTAYNFYEPQPNKQFVVTGFVLKADKQVSGTVDADVILYEADEADTTDVTKVLFQAAMVQGDLITMTPLNILVNEGKFINGKTTDDDIHVTIMGYVIDALT